MANLSQQKRQRMLDFLNSIKEQHKNDDNTLMALNEIETELTAKKYGLVWEQHEEAVDVKMRTHIPVFTEVKEKEITKIPGEGYNFLLEGDNLHSLRLLEKTHKGKIDVIYIDPPYNKEKDFIYDDQYVDSNDTFKHSKWVSFMYHRLKISRKLLCISGCIFISIDDIEQATLKLLCDEIFGENNFISQLVWEKKKKGSYLSGSSTNIKEYVLVYAKRKDCFNGLVGEIKSSKETYPCVNAPNKREIRTIPAGIKSNYAQKEYFLKKGSIISDTTMSLKLHSDLVIKEGRLAEELKIEGNWRYSQDSMEEYALNGELYLTRDLYLRRIVLSPRKKMMKDILSRVGDDENITHKETINPDNLFQSGWGSNEDADEELRIILGENKLFDYPKPVRLIIKLLASIRNKNAVCLDFFSGTGTTGQAVIELNKIDNGNRKFILCTNNENNICEKITYQRLKTIITGKRNNGSTYSEEIPANLKYYRTDFIPKDAEELRVALMEHIQEMIQLEHGVKLDGKNYIMLLDDDDADELAAHWNEYPSIKALYVANDVLFSTEQTKLFSDLEIHTIPDYYFNFELREVGEAW